MRQLSILAIFTFFSLLSYSQQKEIDSLTTLLNSTKDYTKRIELLENLSNYSMRFDLKKAEKYAQKLIEESIKSNDSFKIALGYKLLGNVNHNKSEVDTSIKFFRKGLSYIDSKKNIKIKADLLGSIGNGFSEKQLTDSAFVYWNKAKDIFEVLKNDKALTVLNFNFAVNYFVKGDYTNTIKYLNVTEKHNKEFKNPYFEMRCNSIYGNTFIAVGRYEDAISHLEKAYKIATSNNYVVDIIQNSASLASLKAREGKKQEALELRNKTSSFIEPIQQLKTNAIVLSFHIDHAFLLIDVEKSKRAIEIYKTKVKPYEKYLGILKRDADLLELFSSSSINKKSIKEALNKIYKSENLVHKIQALNLFSNLFRANNNMSMVIETQDSLLAANQRLNSEKIANALHFTLEELGVELKEKENLQLKAENAEQELLTQKANTRNWLLAFGLLALGISAFFIWRRYKLEAKAKQEISNQKDEIEKQKNLVETLQKELHHRIKNNLSFIDLFINLAKGRFPDKTYQTKLNELQNRIHSMFEVHKQLFKKEDVTAVKAKNYIDTLVKNVQQAHTKNNITIANKTDSNQTLLADTSFPVGLIVNEFVTNSYKYAFNDTEKGKIDIDLTSKTDTYNLSLKDNGKGLPKDFNINNLDAFGLETIQLLTKEYGGTFKIDGTNGVAMHITLPKTAA